MNEYKIICTCHNLKTGEQEPHTVEVEAPHRGEAISKVMTQIIEKAWRARVTVERYVFSQIYNNCLIITSDGYKFDQFRVVER